MYTIVRDLLDNCIKETSDVWDWATEVAIVGGSVSKLNLIVTRSRRPPSFWIDTPHWNAYACVLHHRRYDQPEIGW